MTDKPWLYKALWLINQMSQKVQNSHPMKILWLSQNTWHQCNRLSTFRNSIPHFHSGTVFHLDIRLLRLQISANLNGFFPPGLYLLINVFWPKISGGRQWRIQDFPWGGAEPLEGALTSDVGTFWWKCMQKRKNWILLGRRPLDPPMEEVIDYQLADRHSKLERNLASFVLFATYTHQYYVLHNVL